MVPELPGIFDLHSNRKTAIKSMNLYQKTIAGQINRYAALYTVAVCIGLSGFVILEESVAALGTVTALALVCGIGYWAVGSVARRLSEPQLLIIRWMQLLKLAIVLPLVYFHWAPLLTPKPWQAWGYDPQRYFVQAQRWAQAGLAWQARPIGAYVGAVYYYAGLAHVFGPSPAIPALANTLTTLLATLAIIGIARGLVKPPARRLWLLGPYRSPAGYHLVRLPQFKGVFVLVSYYGGHHGFHVRQQTFALAED
jgi:hypothetical protein